MNISLYIYIYIYIYTFEFINPFLFLSFFPFLWLCPLCLFCALYANRPNGDWRRVVVLNFSVLRSITQMVIAGGPFFSSFFLHQSQSLNGDWWRGLFSPPKPIAQTAVGGEGPFFFFFLFFFCPCKPIAQVRLVVRGNLFPPYYSNYYVLSVHWLREKKQAKTTYIGVVRIREGWRTLSRYAKRRCISPRQLLRGLGMG